MAANLDMSLDDRIKMNKPSRTTGSGPVRRFSNRTSNRSAPYSFNAIRAPELQWNNGMYAVDLLGGHGGATAARVQSIETGIKLIISNLHYAVSDEDIEELFSTIGHLKRCSVNYDRSGKSEGTAEVVFSRRRDAEEAIKRYNNVELDGLPMKIEIVGSILGPPPFPPPPSYGRSGGFQLRGGFPGPMRGRGGGGNAQGRGRGGRTEIKISAEDLDADLDKYLAEAKESD